MYYDLFDRDIHSTSRTRFAIFFQFFCGIYGINDLESRLEVIWGRWFLHQSKARIWLPIGPQ